MLNRDLSVGALCSTGQTDANSDGTTYSFLAERTGRVTRCSLDIDATAPCTHSALRN